MLRVPLLGLYVWSCGCNLREAECSDLKKYRNLGMFFRRRLRAGIRPIHKQAALVSPADGQVIHFGRVETDRIEQVKGLTYSLAAFLGPQSWKQKPVEQNEKNPQEKIADENYRYELCHHHADDAGSVGKTEICAEGGAERDECQGQQQKSAEPTSLFHCIIYLSPGDYHRFHSPTEWQVFYRRHFPGELEEKKISSGFFVYPRAGKLFAACVQGGGFWRAFAFPLPICFFLSRNTQERYLACRRAFAVTSKACLILTNAWRILANGLTGFLRLLP